MTKGDVATDPKAGQGISFWTTLLLAFSCGLIAANIYYAQPLAGPIGLELGISPGATGLIVTLTQIGYGVGLLFIVPIGDLVETRRLAVTLLGLASFALLGAALSKSPDQFLAAALLIGLTSVTAQVLVPYAAHLAPAATRGRVVGNVMGGLMLGIMLARPASSFIAEIASWRAVFFISAGAMILLATMLRLALPSHEPSSSLSYGKLLASMAHLVRTTPILRRRALYQAFMFGAFSLFWTTVPLLLAGPHYHLSQASIGLFALAGVAGAIASPIAGRFADWGWTRVATPLGMLAAAGAFLVSHFFDDGSPVSLGLLVAAAILIDFGATMTLVLGQRAIYLLGTQYRSRLNGLFMAIFFAGGAVGSSLGGWAYAFGGWSLTSWLGFALPVAALLYCATES